MRILRTSPVSGLEVCMEISVTHHQLRQWREGMLIQEAMPELTNSEREFIKTGISAQEWEQINEDNQE
jgi:hypothetical protein